MIFSSLQYLIFLPIVVFLYWRTTGGVRLALVVLASYFFYMSWLPAYGLLLFALTCANWLLGLAIERSRTAGSRYSQVFLVLGLILNLGCLCYYKYTNFFLSNIAACLSWMRGNAGYAGSFIPAWDAPVLKVLLPLGISFFVFEFVHYLVDVYKGDKPVRSWMEFAAFASFFPSQIAGPIKRYQDFLHRLRQPERWTGPLFYEGMALVMQGLFKKVAIADPIGAIVYTGFTCSHTLSSADALVASIGFVIQVYCDFSGYTDIGRGSALLIGIRLPENFQLPYLSHDLADFWRRWHMSLSYWLRDYVYIPLGGSRGNRWINWRNLFLTMVACGLWHGAAWHYVIFGSMQGIGLIVNREWKNLLSAVSPLGAVCNTWFGKQLGTFLTMSFITVSYTVFRAPDMAHARYVLSGLFNVGSQCTLWEPILKSAVLQFLSVYTGFWLLTSALKAISSSPGQSAAGQHPGLGSRRLPSFIWDHRVGYSPPVKLAAWTAALILMVAAKPTEATPFVYFQF